jgi:hypothetical protein
MERDEVKAIVREVLAEMLGAAIAPSDARWVGLQSAWRELGYPSYKALYEDVNQGLFRVGKEVRDRRKPGAKIARLQNKLPNPIEGLGFQ